MEQSLLMQILSRQTTMKDNPDEVESPYLLPSSATYTDKAQSLSNDISQGKIG